MSVEILIVSAAGAEHDALVAGLRPRLEFATASELPADCSGLDVVWVHAGPADAIELPATAIGPLRTWVEGGGRLLLTGSVAAWVGPLGFEQNPPVVRTRSWDGPVRPEDRLGVAPFFDHPLFERFGGGVYLRQPRGGSRIAGAFYDKGERPHDGDLIGVEKVHLGVQAETGLLFEHRPGSGHVVGLGAHLVFADGDAFEEARLRFASDLADYLLWSDDDAGGHAWPAIEPRAPELRLGSIDAAAVPVVEPRAVCGGPTLEAPADESVLFDLVLPHGSLVLGDAHAGVREVWQLPARLLTEWTWHCAGLEASTLRVGTDSAERVLETGTCVLRETWRADHAWQREAGVFGGQLVIADRDCRVGLSFRIGERLMWPYPSHASGRLVISTDAASRMLHVEDVELGFTAVLVFSVPPVAFELESGERARYDFDCKAGTTLAWTLALGATQDAAEGLVEAAATLEPRPRRGLELRLSNDEIDRELAWARSSAERFFVKVEALGRERAGLVAGFDLTRPGWCDGRPGHAWFFGRDSLWCSRALLPWGDHSRVADNLRLMARYQGPCGEIYHELTLAGVAHYDAADATPMFVDMVARYVDWTGDEAFAREMFPHVQRAIAFVQEHDRDGDGITENQGVGHGWVEAGPLRDGVEAELWLACFQALALEGAARLATLLGQGSAAGWSAAAAHVRDVIAEQFFDRDRMHYAYALRRDGSFDRSATVFGVMPVLCGLADPRDAARVLEPYARASFAADWGVRAIATTDDRFDAASYQAGSAWPLFAGQVALADFLAGRPGSGWERLTGLTSLVRMFSPGLIGEVFRGDRCEPIGMCRHQAWSHAAVLGTVVEGLLGVRARGDGRLEIAPCVPGCLDAIDFDKLQYRGAVLRGAFRRRDDGRAVDLRVEVVSGRVEGGVDVGCFFPSPVTVRDVLVADRAVEHEVEELGEGIRVWLRGVAVEGRVDVRFDVVPDLLVVDRTVRPRAGEGSTAPKFVARRASPGGDELVIAVEARPGRHSLPVRLPGRTPVAIEGAELVGSALRFDTDGPDDGPKDGYGGHEIRVRFAP